MKHFLLPLIALLLLSAKPLHAQSVKTSYDSTLAKKLNADEYGMKQYVLVLLKTGTAQNVSQTVTDSLFKGHMANLSRLAKAGKLAVAGPFSKDQMYRGLIILNTTTMEEARQLIDTDPAVKAKLLDAEFLHWYGSAALAETLEIHKRINKKSH